MSWRAIGHTAKRELKDGLLKTEIPYKDLKKDYCPQGHKLEGNNVYVNTRGHRECRVCINIRRGVRNKTA